MLSQFAHAFLLLLQGDGIHAIITRALIDKFHRLIAEGSMCYLQYLDISPEMKKYRITSHRFELRFAVHCMDHGPENRPCTRRFPDLRA